MAGSWSSFVSLYGEEPNAAWVWALQDFTEEQLMRGYQLSLDEGGDFPPSLSEFMVKCRTDTNWEAKRLHKEFRPERAIEDKGKQERTDAAAQQALREMKQKLGTP
jgi:uncharacterized protein YdaU (DUF1376 family)